MLNSLCRQLVPIVGQTEASHSLLHGFSIILWLINGERLVIHLTLSYVSSTLVYIRILNDVESRNSKDSVE